jgi:GYF domain 2
MELVWYYAHDGAQTGPVSFGDLRAAVASGQLGAEDLVWKEGTVDWVPARSVAGLFPTVALAAAPPARSPAPPPPPARAPAPAASMRSSARGPAEPLPLGEPLPTAALGPGNEYVELAKEFLRRTTAANPSLIACTPEEEQKLTQMGYDPVVKKYAVWRRAVLWVSVVPTLFAALFGLIDLLAMDEDPKSYFSAIGTILLFLQAFSLFALPVAGAYAAMNYDQLSKSMRVLLWGGAVAVGVPLLVAFMPAGIMLDPKPRPEETVAGVEARKRAFDILMGIQFYVFLTPLVLSLLPAVSRGCVRVKGFLPESLVPGWGLVASIPLFVLLTLATFVMIYHMASNFLLLLGLSLWIGAPLIYLTKYKLLTRPITESQDIQALAKTQLYVLAAIALGILLILIYLFTATFDGKTLLGTSKRDSHLRIWSLDLHRIWIEYLGRSLFLTVLFADLLVKMAVMIWREERAFAGTGAAANFDRTMSGFGEAAETKGLPPVA